MTREQGEQIQRLINLGSQMATVCFNLKQSTELPERYCNALRDAQERWDQQMMESRFARDALSNLPPLFDPIHAGA